MFSEQYPSPWAFKPLSTQGRNLAIPWIRPLISFVSEHIVDNFGQINAGISPITKTYWLNSRGSGEGIYILWSLTQDTGKSVVV